MSGTDVDYGAFATYYSATLESLSTDQDATVGPMMQIGTAGPITGSVGTESAMSFAALNRQAIRSITAYMSDQSIGRSALAYAAANVALAYHDGDLDQKSAIFDVMSGILNPNGSDGTIRGDMNAAASNGQSDPNDPDAAGYVPPPTMNANRQIVDSQGRVLFNADGSPGDPEALADAGIDPSDVDASDAGDGISPYLAYINSVNAAQREYYRNWTGVNPDDAATDPGDFEDEETASPSQQAREEAHNSQVAPSNDYDGEGDEANPQDPDADEAPDVTVYDDPTEESPSTPSTGGTNVPQPS